MNCLSSTNMKVFNSHDVDDYLYSQPQYPDDSQFHCEMQEWIASQEPTIEELDEMAEVLNAEDKARS